MRKVQKLTKNIIVLCDGSWNGPNTKTNVYRLKNILEKEGHKAIKYEEGVGTRKFKDTILGGALALELDDKIKEAYKYIVEEYNREEDKSKSKDVWLFGFSRGAYTVRCVAGMIRNCGILKCDSKALTDYAYEIYRSRDPNHAPYGQESDKFRKSFSHELRKTPIKFLGLWDTVGAHGIPTYTIGKGFEYLKFYDQTVSHVVKHAYQILSTHETLSFLEPCRLLRNSNTAVAVENWFPGQHSEVGGGISSDNREISKANLLWMIEKIKNAEGLLAKDKDYSNSIGEFPKPSSWWDPISSQLFKISTSFKFLHRDRIIPLYEDDGMIKGDVVYNNGDWSEFGNLEYSPNTYKRFYRMMADILIKELKDDSQVITTEVGVATDIERYYNSAEAPPNGNVPDEDDKIAKNIHNLFSKVGKDKIRRVKSFSATDISKISSEEIDYVAEKVNSSP